MKKILLGLFLGLGLVGLTVSAGHAGEIDVLLEKLVEKGYLTQMEASIIKDETKQQVAAEVAAGKSYASPSWTQKIKLKGDVRLRYQGEKKESSDHVRNRGRVRYRLGLHANVVDGITIGAGLASGSSDPRSTNQTLEDSFETPDIRLDYAFAEWKPTSGASVIAGKFKRKAYLWAPTDLLWDGDVNPEGASLHLDTDLLSGYAGGLSSADLKGFFNGGFWVLDENGTSRDTDPFLHYFQGGIKADGEGAYAKAAATYYGFNGIKGNALDYCAGTNTGVSSSSSSCSGSLMYDYDSVGGSVELGFKDPIDGLPIQRIAVFGDYINNISDGVKMDTGWAIGAKIGSKKVKKPKSWQLKYIYARLEADAFPDAFPDSDRFGGRTDVKSHEVAVNYALKKNVILGLDYYHSERLDNSTDEEDLLQADLVLKF